MKFKYKIGQKVYIPMYNSIGEIICLGLDYYINEKGEEIYGIKSLNRDFGMHNCAILFNGKILSKSEFFNFNENNEDCEWFYEDQIENLQ